MFFLNSLFHLHRGGRGRHITALVCLKRNWYKMWCNKYKKFEFDRWEIKNTVQEFVFVHYAELDCCYTITSLYKAQPWGCSPGGKWRGASQGLFLYKPGLAVIPTCAKTNNNKKKQHLGHFPQKTHAQHSPRFWPRGKKLRHSLNSNVTTRRRGIHFETLVLCSFYIHFCICMT